MRPGTVIAVLTAANMWLSAGCMPALAQNYELSSPIDGEYIPVYNEKFDLADGKERTERTNGQLWWYAEFRERGAEYLRLHLTDIKIVAGSFDILIRDSAGNTVESIPSSTLSGRAEYLTLLVPDEYVLLMVLSLQRLDAKFTVSGIYRQSPGGAPKSITEPADFQHIEAFRNDQAVLGAAKPVAKLSFIKNGEPHVCTGFLVSNDLLVTNHHCVPDAGTCNSTVALFGYEYLEPRRLSKGNQYRCLEVVEKHFDLDVSVLRLAGKPGEAWGELTLSDDDPAADQQLFIVQHPAGYPKLVSQKGCKVSVIPADGRAAASDFSHLCDTFGGSSGAPVLDQTGRVVGLHHYGFGSELYWSENRAVRMSKILSIISPP